MLHNINLISQEFMQSSF